MKKITSIFTLMAIAFCGFTQNILVPNKNINHQDNTEYVLLSPTGKVIKAFTNIEIKGKIVEDLIVAIDKNTGKLGYLSATTGDWAIPPQYEKTLSANSFSEGLAVIRLKKEDVSQCAVIDKMGKIIVPFTANWGIENFSEGLAIISQFNNGIESSGAIDKTGMLVIPLSVGHIDVFKEGLALKMNEKSKIGYINKTGKWVIRPQWETATSFSEGLALVSLKTENAKYGYINKTGKLVIPYKYDTGEPFSEGFASVGVLVGKGDDEKYETAYIDRTGKLMTDNRFDVARSFSEGLAAVVKITKKEDDVDYRFGFIDSTFKLVIPIEHEKACPIGYYLQYFSFKDGLCPTSKGYIDRTGKLVISFPKSGRVECEPFENGRAMVTIYNQIGDKYKYTLIDKTGKILWQSVDN